MKKKMRKLVTVVTLVLTFILTMAVPIQAENKVKVADWHTQQFKTMYAKMQENEAWKTTLDETVKKELSNYARSEKKQAGALLILKAIELEMYVKQAEEEDDNLISRLVNLLSSKEFQTYLLMSELAKYDGIEVQKNAKGEYTIYEVKIPSLTAE